MKRIGSDINGGAIGFNEGAIRYIASDVYKGLMHWFIYLYEWVIKHIDFDEGMVVGPLFGKFNTNE